MVFVWFGVVLVLFLGGLFGLEFILKSCLFTSAFSQERSLSTENRSEEDEGSDLCDDVHSTTVKLLKLNKAIKDIHSSLSRYLRGKAFFPQ